MTEQNRNSVQPKLDGFEKEIMGGVQQQCNAIAQELEAYRKQELERYAQDVQDDAAHYVDAEVTERSVDTAIDVYNRKNELKRALYQKREEACSTVFAAAAQELRAFAASAEYPAWLLKKAALLGKRYGQSDNRITGLVDKVRQLGDLTLQDDPQLLVRQEDLSLADELKKAFGAPCIVTADPGVKLGGVILSNPKKSYRADETLDAALEKQKQWFYAQSGLTVHF